MLDDSVPEDLETFTVELSSASGATIRDGSGTVTIIDNDEGAQLSLSIADAPTVQEAAGATVEFTVTLNVSPAAEVTVNVPDGGRHGAGGPGLHAHDERDAALRGERDVEDDQHSGRE